MACIAYPFLPPSLLLSLSPESFQLPESTQLPVWHSYPAILHVPRHFCSYWSIFDATSSFIFCHLHHIFLLSRTQWLPPWANLGCMGYIGWLSLDDNRGGISNIPISWICHWRHGLTTHLLFAYFIAGIYIIQQHGFIITLLFGSINSKSLCYC